MNAHYGNSFKRAKFISIKNVTYEKNEEPHIRNHKATSEFLWALFPLERKCLYICQMTLVWHCFEGNRKGSDSDKYNHSVSLSYLLWPLLQPFDSDLEKVWSKSSAIQGLVQKQDLVSVPERYDVHVSGKVKKIDNQSKQSRAQPRVLTLLIW